MDERIEKFIKKRHGLTLATTVNNLPWVAHAYYAVAKDGALIFTSSDQTRHIIEALQNPRVAVGIMLDTKVVGRVQGVQIEGELKGEADGDKMQYLKRFPYAATMIGQLWRVEIITAKFTDNTLGFGTKLHYDKNSK